MDFAPDTNKEFIWCAKLDGKSKFHQWEGRDDGATEQIVLKRACLGAAAKENERNIIEVTSFNHKQQKVEACICSLRAGLKEDESLSDLTILPPAVFKLSAGSGPVHLVGNHMIMEDFDEGSDDDDLSDDIDDSQLAEDADDDSEEEDDEEEDEEIQALKQQLAKIKDKDNSEDDDDFDDEDDLDDDDDDDDDEEEEEEEEMPPMKKRKGDAKMGSDVIPKKKKANEATKKDENSKPHKMNNVSQKKKGEQTPKKDLPKTPLRQKQDRTPLSIKKSPKTYSSVSDLSAAIKKYPGGKPKKEEKFVNWVKNTFRVDNHEWVKQLWKAHKVDMGL